MLECFHIRTLVLACTVWLVVALPALAQDSQGFQAQLGLSAGATARTITFASDQGTRRLDTGFIPALGIRMQARLKHERWQLTAAVVYQTSLGALAVQHTPDPSSQALNTPIRSHRLEAGVLPMFRFSASVDSASLGFFFGYGLRALASVAELRVPRYTLHGPLVRLELELPLFARLRLRLAPELSAIVSMTQALQRAAASTPVFVALGGEATLRFTMTSWCEFDISYRESRADAASSNARGFSDRERFLMVGGQVVF